MGVISEVSAIANLGTFLISLFKFKQENKKSFHNSTALKYISILPNIKYNTYTRSVPLWNSGITADMLEGSFLLTEKLESVLYNLLEWLEADDKLKGEELIDSYRKKLKAVSEGAYDSYISYNYKGDVNSGTMSLVMIRSEISDIVDDWIRLLIKRQTTKRYYRRWIKKWENAGKYPIAGKTTVNVHFSNDMYPLN